MQRETNEAIKQVLEAGWGVFDPIVYFAALRPQQTAESKRLISAARQLQENRRRKRKS